MNHHALIVSAPAAGSLELRLAIRDDRRSLAKGQVAVGGGVEK